MQSVMEIEDIDAKVICFQSFMEENDVMICSNYILCKQIRNMEWAMQHEALRVKDEKQFIRDIKQLKQTREKLASTMSRQDENQQGLDRKESPKVLYIHLLC